LAIAGKTAKSSTIYVTLEPCSHVGKTHPCAAALVKAQPKTVVIATQDPNPKVNGGGIKMLEKAGIEVIFGICEQEAVETNKAFFNRIKTGLPYVTLKFATSKDGKFLQGNGKPQWVTGELARNYVHLMRSQHNAIITGTGTMLADNPKLNCRLPGLEEFSPVPVVIGKSKTKMKNKNTLYYNHHNLKNILQDLGKQGFNSVMVEAGPTLSNAFLASGLVDEVVHIHSEEILGKKEEAFLKKPLPNYFKKTSTKKIGEDFIVTYCKN
jgi:diaminohydroxyphosphoribosylaminopyrimidine deaminase/5-amino-6-(5-phosphoribosylamino)uracil reductase